MKFETKGSAQHFWLVSVIKADEIYLTLKLKSDFSDNFLVLTRFDCFRRFGSNFILDQKMQV